MLPLIVTVCLSRGARAMASGKAIVRRLDAIETLGGMDVLCVDKTGTLTSGAGAGTSGNVSRIMVVKGAVSEMLPRCDTVMRNGTAEPLTIDDCIRWHDHERIKRSLGWMSPVQYRQSQGTAA